VLLDDPNGEGVPVGILSSETEDSISRKFEQSSGRLAQVAAGPVLVGSPTLSFDAEEPSKPPRSRQVRNKFEPGFG
jgi:hypothetical protein